MIIVVCVVAIIILCVLALIAIGIIIPSNAHSRPPAQHLILPFTQQPNSNASERGNTRPEVGERLTQKRQSPWRWRKVRMTTSSPVDPAHGTSSGRGSHSSCPHVTSFSTTHVTSLSTEHALPLSSGSQWYPTDLDLFDAPPLYHLGDRRVEGVIIARGWVEDERVPAGTPARTR
eukprot:3136057-Rhodomonas_salina.1